jgi:hypothetical protein
VFVTLEWTNWRAGLTKRGIDGYVFTFRSCIVSVLETEHRNFYVLVIKCYVSLAQNWNKI